jgi:hypothetical protein
MAISFANLFCYVERTVEETPRELTSQRDRRATNKAMPREQDLRRWGQE